MHEEGRGLEAPALLSGGADRPLLQKAGGNVFETFKVGLAALAVAVASFMALSGPAMAVECEHTNERGVIECGKKDNVFLSEDRFFDNNPDCFRCNVDDLGFIIPVFATDVDELGCWEWSWVFERWEWEDDCD